jgi:hypothetical protein
VEMYTELEQNSHLQDKGEKDDEHRGEEDSSHILRQKAEYPTHAYQLVLFTF